MIARRNPGAPMSLLLAGLCLGLAACEHPQGAGFPAPVASPSGESPGPEVSAEPTPSTGNVQPIITF